MKKKFILKRNLLFYIYSNESKEYYSESTSFYGKSKFGRLIEQFEALTHNSTNPSSNDAPIESVMSNIINSFEKNYACQHTCSKDFFRTDLATSIFSEKDSNIENSSVITFDTIGMDQNEDCYKNIKTTRSTKIYPFVINKIYKSKNGWKDTVSALSSKKPKKIVPPDTQDANKKPHKTVDRFDEILKCLKSRSFKPHIKLILDEEKSFNNENINVIEVLIKQFRESFVIEANKGKNLAFLNLTMSSLMRFGIIECAKRINKLDHRIAHPELEHKISSEKLLKQRQNLAYDYKLIVNRLDTDNIKSNFKSCLSRQILNKTFIEIFTEFVNSEDCGFIRQDYLNSGKSPNYLNNFDSMVKDLKGYLKPEDNPIDDTIFNVDITEISDLNVRPGKITYKYVNKEKKR